VIVGVGVELFENVTEVRFFETLFPKSEFLEASVFQKCTIWGFKFPILGKIWGKIWTPIITSCRKFAASCLWENCEFFSPPAFLTHEAAALVVKLWPQSSSMALAYRSINQSHTCTYRPMRSPVFYCRIASRKFSPGRQFISKNPPRPAAARAGRIFTDKLSAGGDFWGRFYNGETFYGAGDILIRRDVSIPWLSLPGRIFHGETF